MTQPSVTPTDADRAAAADLRKRAEQTAADRQAHLDRAAELNRAVTALHRSADLIDGGQAEIPGVTPTQAQGLGPSLQAAAADAKAEPAAE